MTPAQHALIEYFADLIVADREALADPPNPMENATDATHHHGHDHAEDLRTDKARLAMGDPAHRP